MATRTRIFTAFVLLAGLTGLIDTPPASAAIETHLHSDPDPIWDVDNIDLNVRFTGQINARVFDFVEHNGRMFVGGKFLDVVAPDGSTRDQPYLAAFDVESGAWISTFRPNLDGPVYALEMTNDGRLLAGGELTGGVVAIHPATGAIDNNVRPNLQNSWSKPGVFDIEVVGAAAYVGGRFATAQNVALANLAKINVNNGTLDTAWTPKAQYDTGTPRMAGQLVYAIAVDPSRDRVYVAGKFGSINGNTNAAYFAVLSQSNASFKNVRQGLPPQTLNHRETASMWQHDVQFKGDFVYLGGQAHQTLVLQASNLDAVKSVYTNRGVGDTHRGGDTQVIYVGNDHIWSGCHCWGSVGPYQLGSYNARADGVQTLEEYREFEQAFDQSNPFGQRKVWGAYALDLGNKRISKQQFNIRGQAGAWAIIEDSRGRLWLGGQFDKGNGRVGEGIARFSPEVAGGLAPVASCTVTFGNGQATVTWPAAANAAEYVVYRTVNGSAQFWRGRTSALSFNDSTRTGTIKYFVVSKRGTGRATPVQCGENPAGNLAPVANCAVTNRNGGVTVSWPAAANASEYVVSRTVDGSPQHWRGLTSQRSFDDTVRPGTIRYFVASKRGTEVSGVVACG